MKHFPLVKSLGVQITMAEITPEYIGINAKIRRFREAVLVEDLEVALQAAPVGEAIKPEYIGDTWMFDTRGSIMDDRPVYEARLLIGPIKRQPDTAESLLREFLKAGYYHPNENERDQIGELKDRARKLLEKNNAE